MKSVQKEVKISDSVWNNSGFKESWTVTDIEDHLQFYLFHHPEVKKLKTWDKQIQYLIKRNHQLTNEIRLWSGSAIYSRDMMLSLMKHTVNPKRSDYYDAMKLMVNLLHRKLKQYTVLNISTLNKLFD